MKNQIKTGAILTYITLFLGNAISLFYTPYMLKVLGQSEFGLYSLANTIVGYLTVLDMGIGSTTVRYVTKYREEKQYTKEHELYGLLILVYSIIGFMILSLGIVFIPHLNFLFSKGLSEGEIILTKKLIFLALLNMAFSFPFGIFTSIITAYEKFVFLKVTSLIRYLLNPLFFIPILALGYKSVGLIIASTVLNISFLFVNLLYCFIKLKIKITFKKIDFGLLAKLGKFSFWLIVSCIVQQLMWNSGNFLLGMFSSATTIGVFSIAMQFRGYFELFSTVITSIFLPKMTKFNSRNATNFEFSECFIKIGKIQFLIISLITTGFVLFGKKFISLWAGIAYEEAYYVGLIIFIPLSLVYTQALGVTILQAKNKHKFYSIITFIFTILFIILSIPFVQKYNIYACAISTSLSLLFGHLILLNIYYSRVIGLNIKKFWLEIIRLLPGILIPFIIMILLIHNFYYVNNYMHLFIFIFVYIILYAFGVFMFSLSNSDRNILILRLKLKKDS